MTGLVLLGMLLSASFAHAQLVNSPRGMAMSAVRADPVGSSALIYNPAGMSRSYLYAAEAAYFRSAPADVNAVSLNVVDSKTQPRLAAGMSYGLHFTDEGTEPQESGHDVRLGFAHPAIQDTLNLGVSLRYLGIEKTENSKTEPFPEGYTIDLGVLISPSSEFHIGLTAHNLIDLDHPNVPRRAGGGIAYTGQTITLGVDALVDFSNHLESPKPVLAGGFELLLAESVPLRGGFTYDGAVEQKWVTGGLGFMTGESVNGGQFSFTYRQNLDESSQYSVGLGLTIYI